MAQAQNAQNIATTQAALQKVKNVYKVDCKNEPLNSKIEETPDGHSKLTSSATPAEEKRNPTEQAEIAEEAEEIVSFRHSSLTTSDTIAASEWLFLQGCLLEAIKLLDWVLVSQPDDADVLAERGWLLVKSRNAELTERGIDYLDAALNVYTFHPHALAYRAIAHLQLGNADKAQTDLESFEALDSKPPSIAALIESFSSIS